MTVADTSDIARLMAERYATDPGARRNPLLELGNQGAMPTLDPLPDRRPSIASPNWRPQRRPESATAPAEQMVSDAIFGAIMAPYSAGHAAAEGVMNARAGKPGAAAMNGAELAALMVPGRRGATTRPMRSLEEYVDTLGARPSVLNYETYLSDPLRTVNGRSRTFETMEPEFKREVSQEAKNLGHWKNLDALREKRDAGLLSGPEGNPVNPWYWPAPLYDAFARELGPELAHDRLSKFFNYNASTSMQTAVPRNVIEAWHVLYNDLNGIRMGQLSTGELTGAAHPNKVAISGQIASGEGIKGETAHKIRNYSLNLHGVGTAQPEYKFPPGGEAERILSPATLDSIMAEAMKLRNKSGEPSERFKGPIYRHGVGTINGLGEEVGAAAADTQAAIWQQHQLAKHGTDVYNDSYARIFDDVMHRVARERGEDPNKTMADLVHGKQRPPNFFTPESAAALLPPGVMLGLYARDQAGASQ